MSDDVVIDRFTAAFLVGVLEAIMMQGGRDGVLGPTRDKLLKAMEDADLARLTETSRVLDP